MRKYTTFNTLEVLAEFDYTPAEPRGDDYPGADSSIEISKIEIHIERHIVPLTSFFEESGLIYKLEEQLKTEMDNDQ